MPAAGAVAAEEVVPASTRHLIGPAPITLSTADFNERTEQTTTVKTEK